VFAVPHLLRHHALPAAALAIALGLLFAIAASFSVPRLFVAVTDEVAASRTLQDFHALEQSDTTAFRWSRPAATLRLFGMEQRGPLLLELRLSATRAPDEPLVQLTLDAGQPLPPLPIERDWRRYHVLVPPPPRDASSRAIDLVSDVDPPYREGRELGVALSDLRVWQLVPTPFDRLPDPSRLLFLVSLGMFGYAAMQRATTKRWAAAVALGLGLLLAVLLALVPVALAVWLPNVWLALFLGLLLLFGRPVVHRLRVAEGHAGRLVGAGLLACAAGIVLLPVGAWWSSLLGWLLMLAGMLTLAGGAPATLPDDTLSLSRRFVVGSLALITVLALGLRLAGLDSLPLGMWHDEARGGTHALQIWRDPAFRPVYLPGTVDVPALLFYLASPVVALFGPQPWAIRFPAAMVGALTPLALYWAARPLFGPRVALFAAALLACSAWHITLSRLAFAAALGPPVTALAVGCMWRALQPGGSRLQVFQAALAGTMAGLALYTYHPARLTPLLLALLAVLVLGAHWRAWRAELPRLALGAGVALLVAWPMLDYARNNPESYVRRLGQTSLFAPESADGNAYGALVADNLRAYLGMWHERGDAIGRHNLPGAPQLDPVSGLLFAAGIAVALARLRDRRARFVLAWLGLMALPGIFAMQAPHAVRAVETIPPTMLLAALGGWLCAVRVPELWPRRRTWISAAGAVLLALVLVLNAGRYFVLWPRATAAYTDFYVAETEAARAAQRLAAHTPGVQLFFPRKALEGSVLVYLLDGLPVAWYDEQRTSAPPTDGALLFALDGCEAEQRAIVGRVLGAQAQPLGSGRLSPITGCSAFVIYGRDETARQAVNEALAGR
jgi:4-amino-4-deoxy-L-arabinose transferase-like glycosyltransferase